MMASSCPFGNRLRRSCTTASALAASKSSVHAGHFLILRVLGAKLIPPLGAQDLRRRAGDAHDVGDLGLLAAEGLIEKLALKPTELDVIGADIGEHVHLASPEASLVVDFDQRNLRVIDELDAGDDSVAGGREKDEVLLLRDEILKIGEFGRDVAAVAVDEVVGESELFGAVLKSGLEVRVERHLQVRDADADFLVGRRWRRAFRQPLRRQAAQFVGIGGRDDRGRGGRRTGRPHERLLKVETPRTCCPSISCAHCGSSLIPPVSLLLARSLLSRSLRHCPRTTAAATMLAHLKLGKTAASSSVGQKSRSRPASNIRRKRLQR